MARRSTVTGGYLDELDVPPWDTWVAEVQGVQRALPPTIISYVYGGEPNRGVLVAWVPREFVPLIDLAMDEECMGMLCGADTPAATGPGDLTFADIIPTWLAGFE